MVRGAYQVSFAAVVLAEHQMSGHITLLPHLAVESGRLHVVRQQFSVYRPVFWHDEERDPFHPGRRSFDPCQQQVHHIVDGFVIAAGNEDLLALDRIALAIQQAGRGRQIGEGAARLRLGEGHRALPATVQHGR